MGLPYEDPHRSMLIVLPNAGTSTQDLVQRLGSLDLASIRTNGKLAKTSIFIPKFKLKFKTYLKQQMESLGVRDLFAHRPFLFVVYDFEHGVTLFAGKVVNPNNDNV